MAFADVSTAAGLAKLNEHLKSHSYVEGYSPSSADTKTFDGIKSTPDSSHPHVLRWYNHIKSFGALKASFRASGACAATFSAAPVKYGAGDEDEDVDLFASDEEEDAVAANIREDRLKACAENKSKEPESIAKSNVILDVVKPWNYETHMKKLEEAVRSVEISFSALRSGVRFPSTPGTLSNHNEVQNQSATSRSFVEPLRDAARLSCTATVDSIPNEILLQIIGCLEKQEIPKLRLVNHRFNQLSTTCLPKLFEVKFWNDSDIVKFISVFERKKTAVPFQKFRFSRYLSTYGHPLEEFCVQFGSIVKSWGIRIFFRTRVPHDSPVLKNIEILFDRFEIVEEIEYSIVEEEMSKAMEIPVLKHLKTINIVFYDSEDQYDDSLLLKLLQKAPNLRNVSIDGNIYESDSSYHALVPNILEKIYRINGPVLIEKLAVRLLFPALNMDELENFVAISTKHKILDLELFLKSRDPSSGSASQTMEIISNWIQKLTSLRKLFLECRSTDDFGPITLPIRSLANIACLELYFPHESITLRQPVEFPALTTLDCIYSGTTDKFIFAGCIFPNVKFAQIYLKTEQERQHWPLVLPNVTELCVVSETLEGIFQFPKVQKLHIYTESDTPGPDWDRDLQLKHWNHLTNGAQYISHSMITNSLLETGKTSESVHSFRNFPVLTHLKFLNCSIECWKGVIYASQTGQLRRLQKLVVDHRVVNEFEKEEYLEVLMKYHDSAITTAQHCIPPFLWNELFLE